MSKKSFMTWWENNTLRVIVFITGAAVLVIEITATRILSPFFGNTIYSVSAVISVILGALSVGYAHGGIRADAKPTFHEFYTIIYRGGLSLFALCILTIGVLPLGGHYFSNKIGPLFWSMVLFFPPGYLLGMLSPFAIKLGAAHTPLKGLGSMSGNIFFWSTLGSIAGSLLAGFVLIPSIGITAIIFGTTAVIVTLGGIGLIHESTGRERRNKLVGLIMLLIALLTVYFMAHNTMNDPRMRFVRDGVYERLGVIDTMYAGRPARFFLQDRSASGGMYLDGPDLALDYSKYYALYKLATPDLSRALIVGGGIYTIPAAIHNERPEATIDVAEIEPELEAIAEKYFHFTPSPQIRTYTQDGRRFLSESAGEYDLIFTDVFYSLYSIPTHFTTKEFFTVAKNRLAPNGMFMANIIGSSGASDESLLFSEIRTMKEVFPYVTVFAVDNTTSTDVQNFIVIGMNQELTSLPERLAASTDPFLQTLPEHLLPIDDAALVPFTILTDDYAPVDHLIAQFMTKHPGGRPAPAKEVTKREAFSGAQAMEDITNIVAFGSRAIGTAGHDRLRDGIMKRLDALKIRNSKVTWTHTRADGKTVELTNIIARINPEATKRIILGTHYDSIMRAYRDPENPAATMPGANNSASGVALLLETARLLPQYLSPQTGVDIVFFDGEEGERALGEGDPNWRPLGSIQFASTLSAFYPTVKPDHAIVLDMVCDRNLQLFQEKYSTAAAKTYQDKFWSIGNAFAPEIFTLKEKYTIGDDQLPLIAAGVPAFLVIDFDYAPWYNTTEDTPDKCSAVSLTVVGETLLSYLHSE